jgi:hypothetical protein
VKKIILIATLLTSFSSIAAHHCLGKVNNVAIAGNGNLHVNVGSIGDGNIICNTGVKLGEYTPEACKAVMSLMLSAKMANKNIRIYFRNDSNTSCAKGNWQNLASSTHQVYYIGLEG